jgi:hypothetical protein
MSARKHFRVAHWRPAPLWPSGPFHFSATRAGSVLLRSLFNATFSGGQGDQLTVSICLKEGQVIMQKQISTESTGLKLIRQWYQKADITWYNYSDFEDDLSGFQMNSTCTSRCPPFGERAFRCSPGCGIQGESKGNSPRPNLNVWGFKHQDQCPKTYHLHVTYSFK